jgi:hypothetical protein
MRAWIDELPPETLAAEQDDALVGRAVRIAHVAPAAVDVNAVHVVSQEWKGSHEGLELILAAPYNGCKEVFDLQPVRRHERGDLRTRVWIGEGEIRLIVRGDDQAADRLKAETSGALELIQKNLDEGAKAVAQHNGLLKQWARQALATRREQAGSYQAMVETLGFPLRRRPDADAKKEITLVRRESGTTMGSTARPRPEPEPELQERDYDQILADLERMGSVMERDPGAFGSLREEALRAILLVPLNLMYEGQATGETFNYEGKTDILIRSGGRNVFIAECKFWSGPNGLADTIDQILGYLCWRDTKAAIVLFNRVRQMTTVLSKIVPTVENHPNHIETVEQEGETRFRFTMSHRDDPERQITLTVLVLDVPKGDRASG